MSKPNKTFIVLGMHRSATSLVSKGLHKAGVVMGEKMLSGLKDNPEGHYEDVDFIEHNIKLLKGDNWKKPGQEIESRPEETKKLLQSKNLTPLWGWKDPRTTLTIKEYTPYLEDPILVCNFRNPEKVAESLKKRNNIPLKEGVKLAKAYNKKLLDYLYKNYT